MLSSAVGNTWYRLRQYWESLFLWLALFFRYYPSRQAFQNTILSVRHTSTFGTIVMIRTGSNELIELCGGCESRQRLLSAFLAESNTICSVFFKDKRRYGEFSELLGYTVVAN